MDFYGSIICYYCVFPFPCLRLFSGM